MDSNSSQIEIKQQDSSMLAQAASSMTVGSPKKRDLHEDSTERHHSRSMSRRQRSGSRSDKRRKSPLHTNKSRSPSAYRHRSSHRSRSRSRNRNRSPSLSPSPSLGQSRSRSRNQSHSRSRSHRRSGRSRRSSTRSLSPEVDESERDLRTVFAMQLSSRLRRSDLVDFFSSAGRVRDAKIVAEKGSRRSRGVAYVEFYSIDSAAEAVNLSGQKLLGIPIIVQPSEAQKNRQSTVKQYSTDGAPVGSADCALVYVHNIEFAIESDDLRSFFELFGRVEYCHLFSVEDDEWAAFVKFDAPAPAQAAIRKLNGLELFGVRLRMRAARRSEQERENERTANERLQSSTQQEKQDVEDSRSTLVLTNDKTPANHDSQVADTIGDDASCRVLRLFNMFDSHEEPGNSDDWIRDIEQDVSGECSGFGQVDSVRVESKSATGSVLVRFAEKAAARSAYLAMNQRWFGGRKIEAALVPDDIGPNSV
ncbi:splicing factor [Coemansia sp. RSA 486]|nr:splicing factor [Coemansia sp. RSA 486]